MTVARALMIALAIAAADQASKFWLIGVMYDAGSRIEVTPFFNLVMVWNRGVSFGLFQSDENGRWLLVGLTVAIMIGLLIWLRREDRPLARIGISGVLGGALGNVIDRASPRAAVADFFDAHFMGYHWPAFNVADMAITVAVAVLIWDSFRGPSDEDGAGSRDETGPGGKQGG
jgi:signal peptidase II